MFISISILKQWLIYFLFAMNGLVYYFFMVAATQSLKSMYNKNYIKVIMKINLF